MQIKKQIKLDLRDYFEIETKLPNLTHLSHEDLVELSYRQANISHWKLDSAQRELSNFFINCKNPIVVGAVSRQTGKSFTASVTAFEFCLKNTNVQVKYCAADGKQALKAVRANMMGMIGECPKDLRPVWSQQLNGWRFKNGSILYIEGVDPGKVDALRGTPAHLIIVDEAAYISDLQYAINNVLFPMTTTTNGKILIISTPPKSKGHEFVEFVKLAKEANAYFELDIYTYLDKVKNDHAFFKSRIDEKRVELIRKTSLPAAFNKEYLLKYETDMDNAVIPEFTTDLKLKIVKDRLRPKNYQPYVAMDLAGIRDLNAIVFGYYDPNDDLIVIEDELQLEAKNTTTDILAKEISTIEKKLWGNAHGEVLVPVKRYCDINERIAIRDLQKTYKLKFNIVQKTMGENEGSGSKNYKEAAIMNLRTLLYNEVVVISPKCKHLIFHLENAVWNKAGNSFERSSVAGHYDFVDAAIYFARAIKRKKADMVLEPESMSNRMNLNRKSTENPTTVQLKKIFAPKIRRF